MSFDKHALTFDAIAHPSIAYLLILPVSYRLEILGTTFHSPIDAAKVDRDIILQLMVL